MKTTFLSLKQVCLFLFFSLLKSLVYAQSPTNLTADVALSAPSQTNFAPFASFSTTAQLVAAFNAGRRAEEVQLGLPANSLGNLTLPANYTTYSPDDRALFIINQERIARAGLVYPGTTAVLGLPLEGVESALDNTAQGHASYLVANNLFSHTGSGGTSSFDRINNTYPAACRRSMGYSENIYVSCTSSNATPDFLVEQAVFSWLYRDSGASWGHRKAILIQNDDIYLAPPPNTLRGYVNDHGNASSEGFLGIGIASAPVGSYNATCPGFAGHVVVMNIADPTAEASCTYNTTDALPVQLLYFTGASRQGKTVLGWSTGWEQNNAGFHILKSRDARSFEKVGYVRSKGSRSETTTYDWTDDEVVVGETYYYRLQQMDANGQSELSKLVAVVIELSQEDFYLYPNPSIDGRFSIVASGKQPASIKLLSTTGVELPTRMVTEGASSRVIPNQFLPAGLYWVKVQDENGRVQKILRLLVGH